MLTLVGAAFFATFAVMLSSYLGILHTVCKDAVHVHNKSNSLDLQLPTHTGLQWLQRQQQVSLDLSFKTKAFTTILILFVGFSLCWLPHSVYSLLSRVQLEVLLWTLILHHQPLRPRAQLPQVRLQPHHLLLANQEVL